MGTWIARNVGLTGGALIVRWIVQNPATKHLANTSHDLWIATAGGIHRSINGGRQWNEIVLPDPSNDEFMREAPIIVGALGFYWIGYDPTNELTLYVLAAVGDETDGLLWIYKTTNLGVTWISRGVLIQFQF